MVAASSARVGIAAACSASIRGMLNPIPYIDALLTQGAFDAALATIAQLPDAHQATPQILVLKAKAIQLSDAPNLTLNDAETALTNAITADPEHVPALIQLAYFKLNVLDDPTAALPLFQAALDLQTHSLKTTLGGLIACRHELGLAVPTLNDLRLALVDEQDLSEF